MPVEAGQQSQTKYYARQDVAYSIMPREWSNVLGDHITPDNPAAHPVYEEGGKLTVMQDRIDAATTGRNGTPKRQRLGGRGSSFEVKTPLDHPIVNPAQAVLMESNFRSRWCHHDGVALDAADVVVNGDELVFSGDRSRIEGLEDGFIVAVWGANGYGVGRVTVTDNPGDITLAFDFSDARIGEHALPDPSGGLTLHSSVLDNGENNRHFDMADHHPGNLADSKIGTQMITKSMEWDMGKDQINATYKGEGLDFEIREPVGTLTPEPEPVGVAQGDAAELSVDGVEMSGGLSLTVDLGMDPKTNPNTRGAGTAFRLSRVVNVMLGGDADFTDAQDLYTEYLKGVGALREFLFAYRPPGGLRLYVELFNMEQYETENNPAQSATEFSFHRVGWRSAWNPADTRIIRIQWVRVPE